MKPCEPMNPIGTCFDSTAFNMLGQQGEPAPYANERVCHAIGTANMPGQEGRRIGHAWIEFTDKLGRRIALDTTWGTYHSAQGYRERFKVEYCVEYTAQEVVDLWLKYDHPGPWDRKIKAVVDGANEGGKR